MGRLNKLKNLTTSTDIISNATYNPMGELLTMTGNGGAPSETRTYNSIGQMKQFQTTGVNIQYNFSSTNNNGKIANDPLHLRLGPVRIAQQGRVPSTLVLCRGRRGTA
jgi:hypothetical protein